jgi:2-polyprenyl-3-methyl-5-hydroxy-6-metoxy-1,4-benzoquinol methylase
MRKALVVRLDRRRFRWSTDFSMGALGDLRSRDPETLHRFLWSNHLAYAARYEVERKFESHNINPTRHTLFRQILEYCQARALDPHEQIRSVFDVGCSLGYLLRHIELNLLPSAAPLQGIDIDRYAVQAGMSYLQSVRSRVELFEADLSRAGEFMRGRQYDLVLCCGVLMYASEDTALRALQAMFAHCRRLVGIICLAHGERLSAKRVAEVRMSDGAYVHDMDRMIREAGGTPISSTWVGTATSGSSPSYVILAEPQAPSRH